MCVRRQDDARDAKKANREHTPEDEAKRGCVERERRACARPSQVRHIYSVVEEESV